MSENLRPRYLQIKDELQKFSDENYDELIKAIISFELCEENEVLLNRLMNFYTNNDDCYLLSNELRERLEYEKYKYTHVHEVLNQTATKQETEVLENTLQVMKGIQNYLIKIQDEFEIQNHLLTRLTQAIEREE